MDKEKVSEAYVLDWIPGCSTIRTITHSSRIATMSVRQARRAASSLIPRQLKPQGQYGHIMAKYMYFS